LSKFRRPPQGTHSIVSPKAKEKIESAAAKVIEELRAYQYMETNGGDDWEAMKPDTEPNSDLFCKLAEKHGNAIVFQAWKYWRNVRGY
jgi:hypothetical protein